MRVRALAGVIVLMVVAGACGDGTTTTTMSATEPAAVTTTGASTTIAEPSTTIESTTTTEPASMTTTAPVLTTTTASTALTTVEAAVAHVEAWLADEYQSSEPPDGVLGPSDVVCAETGPIAVGSVLACSLVPNTAPELQLDEGGVVIYVIDDTGRAAWTSGTDVPDSAAGLADALVRSGTDLFCEDLMDPDVLAHPFSGVGRPADSAYFWSLVYWSLTSQPDRMDADLDGIPCETVHAAVMVSQVLAGGPVG